MKNNSLDYLKPDVAIDIVILKINSKEIGNRKLKEPILEVLVIDKDFGDGIISVLPGKYIDAEKEIEETINEILANRAKINNIAFLEQLYTFADIDRDPRGRVISISYLAIVNEVDSKKLQDAAMKWTDVNLIKDSLGFDHNKILDYAVERLQSKGNYTDILFNFLPEKFTLGEGQKVYELIYRKKINNFQRKTKDYLVELEEVLKGQQFRPAKLYRMVSKEGEVKND